MSKINSISMIETLFMRLSKSSFIDKIVLATTKNKEDLPLCHYLIVL